MPTKIVYGLNELENIDRYIDGRKTLLITSQGFVKRGLVDKIKSFTDDIVYVVSSIKSHPEFKDLEKIYDEIRDINFELILAVGGGSVIDSAKYFIYQNDKKDISLISVPTTAGTSSEITPWATIWDMDAKKKYSIEDKRLFSEVAIYDATITLSVSIEITIQTGLDTLSHALESIWNKNANEITVNYATKSAKLIMQNLENLVNDLDNLTYRDNIMKASMYAGLAFSNTKTAIAHAMSYYITTHKNIPHGIACSFTLPMLIDNVIGKYDFIDKALIEIFGELSSNKLQKLLNNLSINTNFKDYGVTKEDVLKNINLDRLGNSLIQDITIFE